MCFTFVRKVRLYAVPQTLKHIQKKTISKEYTMLMNVGCLSEYDDVVQHMHETEEKLYSQLEKLEAKVQMKRVIR
jgi:hypothetical protein